GHRARPRCVGKAGRTAPGEAARRVFDAHDKARDLARTRLPVEDRVEPVCYTGHDVVPCDWPGIGSGAYKMGENNRAPWHASRNRKLRFRSAIAVVCRELSKSTSSMASIRSIITGPVNHSVTSKLMANERASKFTVPTPASW